MAKILILRGDSVEHEITIENNRFAFILNNGKCYHIDLSDGNMWKAKPGLNNLGKGHKKIVKARLNAG